MKHPLHTNPHDRYLRYAFGNPKQMAELLKFVSQTNPNLAEFLKTVDLNTLTEISESYSEVATQGYADLAFTVKLKDKFLHKKEAELLVGILAEHKSSPARNIMEQLVNYWFQIMVKKQSNIPTVAIIIYNGKDPWKPILNTMYPNYPPYYQTIGLPFRLEFIDVGECIETLNFQEQLTPKTALALVAMKYVYNPQTHGTQFKAAANAFFKLSPKERGDFFDKTMLYLRERMPKEHKEAIQMDFCNLSEALGYTTIAQADREEGYAEGREEGFIEGEAAGLLKGRAEEKRQMAKALLNQKVSITAIAAASGLTIDEIQAL